MSEILKKYITEVVRASPAYLQKEKVREELQNFVLTQVSTGNISSQDDLEDFFKTVGMATNALKMVPFTVYIGMSQKK